VSDPGHSEIAVRAVTSEDLLPSACQAQSLLGACNVDTTSMGSADVVFPAVTHLLGLRLLTEMAFSGNVSLSETQLHYCLVDGRA
jgi:hypothetical protein